MESVTLCVTTAPSVMPNDMLSDSSVEKPFSSKVAEFENVWETIGFMSTERSNCPVIPCVPASIESPNGPMLPWAALWKLDSSGASASPAEPNRPNPSAMPIVNAVFLPSRARPTVPPPSQEPVRLTSQPSSPV